VKQVKHLLISLCVITLALCTGASAQAQTTITLLAPMPMQQSFNKLIPGFEMKTGNKVMATYIPTLQVPMKVAQGMGADVNILAPPSVEALSSGNLNKKSATKLASFVVAIVVKKGAAAPDVSSPKAVKNTLLNAKTLVSVDPATGSAGVAAQGVLTKLGIGPQLKDKIKLLPVGMLLRAVIGGDAQMSLGPYVSDVQANMMVDGYGLPKGAYTPTNIVGYVSSKTSDAKAAKALLDYLKGPDAEGQYKAIGMMPAK
jgi:molybdate transport system substrate-binding protein